jgi:hypothetical protein
MIEKKAVTCVMAFFVSWGYFSATCLFASKKCQVAFKISPENKPV